MPQYFFTVRWSDREESDQLGTPLKNDAAALDHACRMIRELDQR